MFIPIEKNQGVTELSVDRLIKDSRDDEDGFTPNDAIEVLSMLSSDVERELYTPMVSDIAQTNIDFIRREIDKKMSGKSIAEEIQNKLSNVRKTEIKDDEYIDESVNNVVVKAEKYILCALLHKKPYAYFNTDVTYLFSHKLVDLNNKDNKVILTLENNNNLK